MLKNLSIRNFAIIESVDIEFEKGLNIIIGETGTGKSIIIDSLSILLGEKALTSFIREGSKKAIIEGIFEFNFDNPVWNLLKENDIDILDDLHSQTNSSQLIIRREISLSGNSRIFINDTPCQYSLLKAIGDIIIDFHGQFDHQSLIDSKNHLPVLDAFANNLELLQKYKNKFSELKFQIDLYNKFKENQNAINKEYELLSQRLSEIQNVNPLLDEDIELEKELKILENSESIHSNLIELSHEVLSEEYSIYDRFVFLVKKLDTLSRFDDNFKSFYSELNQQLQFIKEFSTFIEEYLNSFTFDPKRVEEINQRLFTLQNLKRKYGSISDILNYQSQLQDKINLLSNSKSSEEEFKKSITFLTDKCIDIANNLSNRRSVAKKEFEDNLLHLLLELGFSYIDFIVKLEINKNARNKPLIIKINGNDAELTDSGIDICEFLISTNMGENPKELTKIASGGELSRIMLALKTLGASDKNLPILVFDEIDSGVSGRIAQKVGQLMINFSKLHQIICITHSPQVAAAGNCIISIEKIEENERTISISRKLNPEERIFEIAKFLSGTSVSDSAIESAKLLIKNYKNSGNFKN